MSYLAAVAALGNVLLAPFDTPDFLTDEMLDRGIVSLGESGTMAEVLHKAKDGEPITVAVIGGSITQGAVASRPELNYGSLMAEWWRAEYPDTEITFVNAGIGATGSDIGCHRAAGHLLKHEPDFVVIEYAVNDPNTEQAAETLEGLVRQVMSQPNMPGAMLLFTMHRGGGNAQEWHSKIGEHYGLPMVSFRDATWPEIEAERLKWEDVEGDEVHPNDAGHAICAALIGEGLGRILRGPAPQSGQPRELPQPLISDVFETAALLTADVATPLARKGFEAGIESPLGEGWTSDGVGSEMTIAFSGSSCAVSYFVIKGDMGRAHAWVDDGEPVLLDGWFGADWGGYSACTFVARGLSDDTHALHIKVLDERAEASDGHRFDVHAVLVAGR